MSWPQLPQSPWLEHVATLLLSSSPEKWDPSAMSIAMEWYVVGPCLSYILTYTTFLRWAMCVWRHSLASWQLKGKRRRMPGKKIELRTWHVCQYNTCQIDSCEEELGSLHCFNRASESKATPPTQVVATTFNNVIRQTTVRNFKKLCVVAEVNFVSYSFCWLAYIKMLLYLYRPWMSGQSSCER